MKINNWDIKIVQLILLCLIALICFSGIVIFFVLKMWILGIIAIIITIITMALALSMIVFSGNWVETISIDNEKIVVYRFGKEINRIKWQQVTEIYEKDFVGRTNLAQFYFSDGQDRLLNDKNGNEHFITFRCAREKACLFSKFTDLPIQQMEHNK